MAVISQTTFFRCINSIKNVLISIKNSLIYVQTDNKSVLVRVMACTKPLSEPTMTTNSLTPYDVTRKQWVNSRRPTKFHGIPSTLLNFVLWSTNHYSRLSILKEATVFSIKCLLMPLHRRVPGPGTRLSARQQWWQCSVPYPPGAPFTNMSCKVWEEITYPFPNFNGENVWEWISNFIPPIIMM